MPKLPLNAALLQNIVFFLVLSDIDFKNQFIVSAIKFEKKNSFEVYDIDSHAGEVWLSNIFSSFNVHHLTAHSDKPYTS